jgi:hypothetical protein
MNLAVKRLLYVVAFMAFFAAGPALILYTWGYRYDFNRGRAIVTGVLYLKSYPRRANVTLNGRELPNLTPTQISGLVPGQYQVVVSRPGMTPWRKTLSVQPERVTFAEDIVLFRSRPVLSLVATGTIQQLVPSPDSRLAAAIFTLPTSTSYSLRVLDAQSGDIVFNRTLGHLYRSPKVTWTKSGRRLLVAAATEAQVLIVGNPQLPLPIEPPTGGPWHSLYWDEGDDDALLASNAQGTWRYSITRQRWARSYPAAVRGFIYSSNVTLAVVASGTSTWLTQLPTSTATWAVPLSSATEATFTGAPGALGWVAVTQADDHTWLVDTATATPQVARTWPQASAVRWRGDGLALAVLHHQGVSLLNFDEGWSDEVRAPSDGSFRDVQWYPGGTHVFISQEGSLEVAEADPRPMRNISRILTSVGFSGTFAVTRDSERILVVDDGSESGVAAGLYGATVQ